MRWLLTMKNKGIKKNFKSEAGFTLIEIVLFIILVGVALVPLTRLSVSNLESGAQYVGITEAQFYIQEIMEDLIADYEADDAGRGYDWVRTNWPGTVSSTSPSGFAGSVSISSEQTLNGVTYCTVTIAVTGASIPNMSLTTWIVDG